MDLLPLASTLGTKELQNTAIILDQQCCKQGTPEYSARNRMTFPKNLQLISEQKMGWKDRKKRLKREIQRCTGSDLFRRKSISVKLISGLSWKKEIQLI